MSDVIAARISFSQHIDGGYRAFVEYAGDSVTSLGTAPRPVGREYVGARPPEGAKHISIYGDLLHSPLPKIKPFLANANELKLYGCSSTFAKAVLSRRKLLSIVEFVACILPESVDEISPRYTSVRLERSSCETNALMNVRTAILNVSLPTDLPNFAHLFHTCRQFSLDCNEAPMGAEIISLLESHARFISMHAGGDNCYNARSNTQTAVTMILWLFHKNSGTIAKRLCPFGVLYCKGRIEGGEAAQNPKTMCCLQAKGLLNIYRDKPPEPL